MVLSAEAGHVLQPLLFLDPLQDLLLFLSAFSHHFFLLCCLKKKKKASQYSFLTLKKEESGKKVDLDLTHGSQPALPCSHRAMLKGFYKRSAKSRQLGIALV